LHALQVCDAGGAREWFECTMISSPCGLASMIFDWKKAAAASAARCISAGG
jgi:hypothetical protein